MKKVIKITLDDFTHIKHPVRHYKNIFAKWQADLDSDFHHMLKDQPQREIKPNNIEDPDLLRQTVVQFRLLSGKSWINVPARECHLDDGQIRVFRLNDSEFRLNLDEADLEFIRITKREPYEQKIIFSKLDNSKNKPGDQNNGTSP
jgi:hypothetical protein